MVCFMESLAESETTLDTTEVSKDSIFFNMLVMTENSWSSFEFCVEKTVVVARRRRRWLAASRIRNNLGYNRSIQGLDLLQHVSNDGEFMVELRVLRREDGGCSSTEKTVAGS
nr:hypothetical protein CFP56_12474 [Quercus suber]